MEHHRPQVHSSAFSSLYLTNAPDRNKTSDVCYVSVWLVEEVPDRTGGHDGKLALSLSSPLAEYNGSRIVVLKSSVYVCRRYLFLVSPIHHAFSSCLVYLMPVTASQSAWQQIRRHSKQISCVSSLLFFVCLYVCIHSTLRESFCVYTYIITQAYSWFSKPCASLPLHNQTAFHTSVSVVFF